MDEQRLKGIESTWTLNPDRTSVTPAAHIAREQVRELVAEVRRLQRLLAPPRGQE